MVCLCFIYCSVKDSPAAGGKPFSFLLQVTCGSRFFVKKNSKKLPIKLEYFKVNCKGQRELLL